MGCGVLRLVGGFGAVSKDSSCTGAVLRAVRGDLVSRDSSSGGAVLRAEAALLRTAPLEELPFEWARRGGASKDSSSGGAVLRAEGARREQNTKTQPRKAVSAKKVQRSRENAVSAQNLLLRTAPVQELSLDPPPPGGV